MAMSEKRHDLAADFFPRALKAAESLRPNDNKRLRNALVNLGMFYSSHERSKEAVPTLDRAAAISERFAGQDREFYAIDLDNLASAHQNLKQYPEAIDLQLKALNIANQLTSGKYLVTTKGVILHNLGASYVELGRYKEAEANFKESISVLSSGGRDVEAWRLKTAKRSYADLLHRTGREREAQELEVPAPQPGAPADGPRATHSDRG
jgi:tetratricopeptide (TPR) repeat protein